MTRKVKEIFVAQKLAQNTSKEQILKEYLNTVYFGGSAYGVGAAASTTSACPPRRSTGSRPPRPR